MAAMDFRRARQDSGDYWPGFVDALATLLLVVIFLLSLFALAQFSLGQALQGRDAALTQLRAEIAALSENLRLETARADELTSNLSALQATLESERDALAAARENAAALEGELAEREARVLALETQVEGEIELTDAARAEVALLNQQVSALNAQLSSLREALEASELRDVEQQAQIEQLSARLNTALARRVQELARFRSEFFEAISNALGDRADIRIVGDRFVFESDVLFPSASAELTAAGQAQLSQTADALLEIAEEIPDEIDWILRVDGHTDVRPIRVTFESNWHLSAARAITVVNYFESRGIPSERLVAAGFGEHRPIAEGDTEEAYAANRRIEIKLDSR